MLFTCQASVKENLQREPNTVDTDKRTCILPSYFGSSCEESVEAESTGKWLMCFLPMRAAT